MRFVQVDCARGGQPNRARAPLEQRRSQLFLDRLELLADRRWRDVELRGCGLETTEPSRGFERRQEV
jgi:hypothetical protein